MDFIEATKEIAEEEALKSLLKKSKTFNAFDRVWGYLDFIARNRISSDSSEGKKVSIDIETALADFNNAFKERGVNPDLHLNWNLC